jgi:hypothetical protein
MTAPAPGLEEKVAKLEVAVHALTLCLERLAADIRKALR